MEYRVLGRTGLRVSEIGLGGEWFNGLTVEESTAIVDAAQENWINYIDIFMPQAPTRSHLGAALAGRREQFIIQGHLCTVFEDGQYTRTRDIEKTRRSFEDLLERLHTDYIDVGMIHYVDSDEDFRTVFEGPVLAYALELKRQGVIRHIGMSSHNPHIALRAVESGVVDVLMFSINPAYDMEAADTDIYDLMEFKGMERSGLVVDEARQQLYSACEAAGVAITVMKPLGAGTLLSAERSPFGVAMTVPQCIQYCLDRNGVKVVIVGCHSVEEVLEAVRYEHLPAKERDYSHIFHTGAAIHMTGRCMYCNHCQPCPAHIDIAAVTKFLDLAIQQETVPETVAQHYWSLSATADDCLMCGRCEPNCPFGVQIRKNMARAREVFAHTAPV
ncbi:aldo/keto reductase [Flavonifractor sp. An135]|nr:aldo/keto reductase [Flavonifractor sp. An135]OUQ26397.1 aldo/keto reductase [Flavonifractor sp. An135]